MNLKQECKYHERQIRYIDLVEDCDERIRREVLNMKTFKDFPNALENSRKNFRRYNDIKHFLIFRK